MQPLSIRPMREEDREWTYGLIREFRGSDSIISAFYPNTMENSRRLKPEIPLVGMHKIPIRDEIELFREL